MISQRMTKLLVEQISHELRAHQLYMGIAVYFERQSLTRWGKLFRDQSTEEAGHAIKIMDFLTDNAVPFELPGLKVATTRYSSAEKALETVLDSERKVSAQYQEMAKTALDEGDHTSHQFLLWFISEQVEEERKAQALIDLAASEINLFQAEPLLDRFE
jgi:ferritin